jgi:hypothetical protein
VVETAAYNKIRKPNGFKYDVLQKREANIYEGFTCFK